jgi:hypothetical protein
MAEKNNNNEAYDQGYKDGKEGYFVEDFFQSAKNVVPLPGDDTEDSYDAGYEDGQTDRYDDDDSSYSGGTSESSGCFITSATLINMDKTDDCEELTLFRSFRDEWLSQQKDGKELIQQYYSIAPNIVERIEAENNSINVYQLIWNNYLSTCYENIQSGDNIKAKGKYISMVNYLSDMYLS